MTCWASKRFKDSREELFDALRGDLIPSHRFVLAELMQHIEVIEARIARFDAQLLTGMPDQRNARNLVQTLPGVDLTGAAMVLVEIGTDMDVFSNGRTCYWQCGACRHQTSLRAGTVMEHGRLPLTKWYLAIYRMMQSKTNIAALALMRQLGISWKAAWLLKHKLMEVMAQREADRPLEGDISVDDAYLGSERNGLVLLADLVPH